MRRNRGNLAKKLLACFLSFLYNKFCCICKKIGDVPFMQKKMLLALLLAASLLLSGCALITVDEEVDNARVVVEVNGDVVRKGTLNNAIDYQIEQNQYMEQMYAMFGMNYSLPTDRATVMEDVVDQLIESMVLDQKAKELGLTEMTEEENAAINEAAETEYQNYLQQIADYYLTDSELEGEALLAEAEKYMAENNLGTKEAIVDSVTNEKVMEKLRAYAIKDVAVTEEEIVAAYDSKVEEAKANYAENLPGYGSAVNNGGDPYYAPAGYRFVKQVLVKFTEEDNAAVAEAQAALTAAQQALVEAAEDADKDALNAAIADAEAALTAANETAKANIKEKVDSIYAAAIAEGADFAALVAEHNEDAGMPEMGYAVCEGFTDFVQSFTDAAMALENVGDVSEPVESTYGFHILQYSADIAEGAVALESVHDALQEELLTAKQDETYTATVETWVSEATVVTYLDRMN